MNKLNWIIVLLLVMLSSNVIAANSDIIITEIMFDPPNSVTGQAQDAYMCSNDSSCQWVEIYNSGDSAIDLSSWKIKTAAKETVDGVTVSNHDFGDVVIQPKSFVVIATQLGDEDGDGFSFAKLYGNKDGIWDPATDGFTAVDSNIPFLATPDLFPGYYTSEDIRMVDETGATWNFVIFSSYYTDPVNVQKNNGYTMERDANGKYPQSLEIGGSPGRARNSPPVFMSIPNVTLNEDQVLSSRLLDFRNFSSDLETGGNDLVFSITSMNVDPSNLINCGVIGTESDPSKTYFFNCTDLAKDTFGVANIFVSVSDGISTANGNFSVNVKNINDAPTFTSVAPSRATATLLYTYGANAGDIEGNSFNFSIRRAPNGVRINPATGVLNWTPTESQVGDHSIEIDVTDTLSQAERNLGLTAASSTQKFTVTVEPIFGFSNVDVVYSDGTLTNVNSTQTIPRVFTTSDVNVTTTLVNRHPAEQGVNILMEDVVFNAKLSKGSQVVFDREISSGLVINSLGTKQIPFMFTMPRDLTEGTYTLTLKAEGDLLDVDANLRDVIVHQTQTFVLYLEVQQARHDVYISSISNVEDAVCTKQSTLRVDVKNSGTRTERDVQLSAVYAPLGISFNSIIDRLAPGETKTAFLNATNAAGFHNITAQVTYSGGTSSNTLVGFEACTRAEDFNKDFCINEKDSELLTKKIGLKSSDAKFDAIFDINKDGVINFVDFFVLIDKIDSECVTITPTSSEPKPPVIISGEGFSVGVSQLKIVLQQGSSVVSQFFLTNKGNSSLVVSNTLEGSFSADDKPIKFEFPSLLSLSTGSSSGVAFKTDVPEQFKLGVYSGTFTLKSNKQVTLLPVEVEVIPDICESGIKGEDISIEVNGPNKNENFKPGDKIDVDLTVKNRGNTRDIGVEGILWNVNKDDEVESIELDPVEIERGSTEKDDFDFEITIPEDVENDKIVLYIKAFEDGNEEQACTVESQPLDVKREKHDVRILGVSAPRELLCDTNAVMRIDARNFGKTDEKAFFRITNNELGLIIESKQFDLKEFDKIGDSISETIPFVVPITKDENSLFLVSVVYDNGASIQSIDKEIPIVCSEDKIVETQINTGSKPNEGKDNLVQSENLVQGPGFKVVQSVSQELEDDLTTQTAVFLSFILGLGIVAYALKTIILMKK